MKRNRLGMAVMAVLIGAIATLFLAGPAGAFHSKNPSRNDQFYDSQAIGDNYHGFDPMETSVPYVAWRGEEIRLVKCLSLDDLGDLPQFIDRDAPEWTGDAQWQIMDWSGDAHVWPKFFDDVDQETSSFDGQGDQENRQCFAIDITSHKPGIAIVKMKIEEIDGFRLQGDGDPGLAHQFNVIWMSLDTPRLRNLGPGNPLGPVTENPNDRNQLGVVVQGIVPLNEEFESELGLSDPLRLPEHWEDLSETSLAHTSWALSKANNGFEGDDNFQNPTCNDEAPGTPGSNDDGSINNPDPDACDTDVGDTGSGTTNFTYIPEPRHDPGDFWDIHDSSGPYNTGHVYGSDKPQITDFCPGAETSTHEANCHVDQHDALDNPGSSGVAQPWDNVIETFVGKGGDQDCDDGQHAGGPNLGPVAADRPRDTVDNCDPGEWDAFSRVFHDVSGEEHGSNGTAADEPTIGPYSPTRPDETLLSDSDVDAHDAPMPAALVIVGIAPNSGATGDISGVGFLTADKDKHEEYNRGGSACTNPENVHCVIAPFSGAYIPPSPTMENNPAQNVPDLGGDLDDDTDTASGIHGPIANNFNGYLPVYYPARPQNRGLYHYWDLVEVFRKAVATPHPAPCDDFSTPGGDQEIALYTDEHGEARLHFNAGEGVFAGALDRDLVQGSCVADGLIGTATITANARYPFQPVTSAGATSNPVIKNIESLFDKGIVCVPKPGEEDDKAICIVFARDFNGDAITGERVCVNVEGQTAASGNVGDVSDLNDETEAKEDQNEVCVNLDQTSVNEAIADLLDGYAGPCDLPLGDLLDEYGSEAVVVDAEGALEATVDFIDENLEFSCDFSIPAAAGTTGASVGGGGAGPTTVPGGVQYDENGFVIVSRNGTSTTRVGGGATANGNNSPTGKKPAVQKRTSILFVRIVKPLKLRGNRYVVLRVKSPQKNARVLVKLIGKRGKVLGTLMRKVKTNRTIRVPNLRLPSAVVTVRVKVIA